MKVYKFRGNYYIETNAKREDGAKLTIVYEKFYDEVSANFFKAGLKANGDIIENSIEVHMVYNKIFEHAFNDKISRSWILTDDEYKSL